ncbi:uncharacterized protein LOC131950422 [Physella acuta]|uniref:uncharacterized protein LOC131950422 n=1 Tax=Physella acuta TaxID=109671 RepID=UPI0027DB6696|nr:uncharacterized protein LOC131950422 [Physella acuta]XP_059168545.1 uncharacterized protein LOC131950422 [Physella acuta]
MLPSSRPSSRSQPTLPPLSVVPPHGILRSPNKLEHAGHEKHSITFQMAPDLSSTQRHHNTGGQGRNLQKTSGSSNWTEVSFSDANNRSGQSSRKVSISSGLSKSGSEFSQYEFYERALTHRMLISDERKKRLSRHKSGVAYKGHDLQLRPAFFSTSRTKEKINDWIQGVYKAKLLQTALRYPELMDRLLSSGMSGTISRKSSSVDPLPDITMSRKSSLVTRPTRRGSVFWEPPSYDGLTEEERQRKREVRTFRWYGRMIRALCGLLMDMKKMSISKTQQSAYSEFLYIMAGPKTHAGQEGHGEESQYVLFDKSWFNRNRAWSRMPEWAQAVMQLPPDERTRDQIHHLKQLLMTMRGFRDNLTDEMRDKMCQVVRYTKCDKGRVVLRQGHLGFDFYYIFSGSVFVQIDLYDEKSDTTYSNVENVLRSGEGFGEIALLGDGRRTASVICKEPTELCQIDKVTFLEICPVMFNQQLQDKISFASKFPLFETWDPEHLKRLCFLSQVLDVPHSTVVESDWSKANYAYFVMKGRLSMLKEFDVSDLVTSETRGRTHRVKKENSKSLARCSQFAHVGMLHHGDCTNLSVLSMKPPKDMTRITLVSDGVRLFRVAVRTFLRISPRKSSEEYLKKVYKPREFPTEEELRAHYLEDLSWSEFKKNIINIHRLQRLGQVIASIPATLKGSSGWARWPGYIVVPKAKKPTEEDELTSDGEDGDDVDDDNVNLPENDDTTLMTTRTSSPGPFVDTETHLAVVNDRTLNMRPFNTNSLTSWRKNLDPSTSYFVGDHIFTS